MSAPTAYQIEDQFPELIELIEKSAHLLLQLKPGELYFHCLEELYGKAHSLKGVISMLDRSEKWKSAIQSLSNTIASIYLGDQKITNYKQVAENLLALVPCLSSETMNANQMNERLKHLAETFVPDLEHPERAQKISKKFPRLDEGASKRAWACVEMGLQHIQISRSASLEELPNWNESVRSIVQKFNLGTTLIIDTASLIRSDNANQIQINSWLACHSEDTGRLEQMVKDLDAQIDLQKLQVKA